ncbi:hypothetical protein [Streptomyces litmocidini]|uniref:hypothetical protein n=1 Tax=Streptomyces litmocidini TaxID=67318 RepID=UPI00370102B9
MAGPAALAKTPDRPTALGAAVPMTDDDCPDGPPHHEPPHHEGDRPPHDVGGIKAYVDGQM